MTEPLFDGRTFAAFLFDMDGTLLSSVAAAEHVWRQWALAHGLDVETFLPAIHGVRSVDTIRRLNLPGIDVDAEAAAITLAEIGDLRGVQPIAGAAAFIASIPNERWAIVTSAPLALARARLQAAGLETPVVLVTAEDVGADKPDPQGYRLAASRLNVAVGECLIFEDAEAGIEAAERAAAQVLVVTQTHAHTVTKAHPTTIDYTTLSGRTNGSGGLTLCA